jgi:hypothetical protein
MVNVRNSAPESVYSTYHAPFDADRDFNRCFSWLTRLGIIADMTTEQFRATLHQHPFRPFTIRMADGRAFDVAHRDFIALSQSGRTAVVFQEDEAYSVLDLLLMSELEVANGRQAS